MLSDTKFFGPAKLHNMTVYRLQYSLLLLVSLRHVYAENVAVTAQTITLDDRIFSILKTIWLEIHLGNCLLAHFKHPWSTLLQFIMVVADIMDEML